MSGFGEKASRLAGQIGDGYINVAPTADLVREPDPVDDPRELFEGEAAAVTEEQAVELRSELARLLTRDEFPLSRPDLLAVLDDKDASAALVKRVSGLPGQSRYHSTHELIEALGLAHAEDDSGH